MIFIQSTQQVLQRRLDSDPARVGDTCYETSLEASFERIEDRKLAAFIRTTEPKRLVSFVADTGLEW